MRKKLSENIEMLNDFEFMKLFYSETWVQYRTHRFKISTDIEPMIDSNNRVTIMVGNTRVRIDKITMTDTGADSILERLGNKAKYKFILHTNDYIERV